MQLWEMAFDRHIMLFSTAIVIMLISLGTTAVLSAGESAVASLTQDELDEIEERNSRIDKLILFLADYLQLTRTSSRIFQFILLIVTALSGTYLVALFVLPVPNIMYAMLFLAVTLLWLFFYGILPKWLFPNRLKTARIVAPVLKLAVNLCKPFVLLTNFPVENPDAEQSRQSSAILDNEAPNSIYEEKEMLEEIIHFYDKKAGEIMTPRTDIEAIDIKSNIDEVIKIIVDSGYSRIPVYEEDEDDIQGILYVKDVLPALQRHKTAEFNWQSLIRKPYFVPESKKIESLLGELRANKTHLAIVVDEFGCTAGLVTMEDIIEEIIGDISDEYDQDEHSFMALPDGSYIFEGKTQLNDFFRETGVPPSDFSELTEEAETLTGLLLAIKGTLPKRRDTVDYKNYKFRILEADERRVLKVKFSINP
jgi:gliding motility-associated protein GldE